MKFLYLVVFLLAVIVRVYGLGSFPPSLYWEEAALGYDAYSILKTGKDHHGNQFPVVAFESFGDWKPSGYFYVLVPFVAALGLSEWAVRLPTVFAGLAVIVGAAGIARQLKISPLAVLFVGALSPWAIQFSRAGWEVTTATACVVWATYFFLRALADKLIKLQPALIGVVLFVLAMYTYHATRLIVPLLLLGLVGLYCMQHLLSTKMSWSKVLKTLKQIFQLNLGRISVITTLFILLTAPLLLSLGSTTTSQRFQETSIFSNLEVIERSNALKEQAGNTLAARLFYHRYVLFGAEILKNYFSHFSLDFLFLRGDSNLRHSIQLYGQLYHVEIVFLLIGLYLWMKQRKPQQVYMLYWLFVSIIPASLTNATPHALRILPALPVFILLIGLGVETVFTILQNWIAAGFKLLKLQRFHQFIPRTAAAVILLIYCIEFLGFWRYYQAIYPQVSSSEWQYGYEEMIQVVAGLEAQNPSMPIYITRELGRPAMYYWFYTQTNPLEVQAENSRIPKDQSEFLQYKNVYFIDKVDQIAQPGIVASTPTFYEQVITSKSIEDIAQVSDPQQKTVWKVYKVR